MNSLRYVSRCFDGVWHAGYFRHDASFVSCGQASTKKGADEICQSLLKTSRQDHRNWKKDVKLCGLRF